MQSRVWRLKEDGALCILAPIYSIDMLDMSSQTPWVREWLIISGGSPDNWEPYPWTCDLWRILDGCRNQPCSCSRITARWHLDLDIVRAGSPRGTIGHSPLSPCERGSCSTWYICLQAASRPERTHAHTHYVSPRLRDLRVNSLGGLCY